MNTKVSYRFIFGLFLCILFAFSAHGQRVGLVFSGGGASGLAHIGVLKALEEHSIPVDYITGTSAGALVGAYYACGYSANEIEAIVLSDLFQLMTKGEIEPEHKFSLRQEEINASMLNIPFSKDSILSKSLPTSFIKPALMDFEMLVSLGVTSASTGENFDSLFIPFRCVASDIVDKKSVIFAGGQLNKAVRASMTFPFYMNPIRVNGRLLFDGGLYNNFPADVMYHEFDPDFIIGSNVSSNEPPPTEDDVFSHLKNMLVSKTTFDLPCETGIMIEPNIDVSTFDFDKAREAINGGYESTILLIDSIKKQIHRRTSAEELKERRNQFRSKITPLQIDQVYAQDKRGKTSSFAESTISGKLKRGFLDEHKLKKQYFRLIETPQISYLFPTINKTSDSTYGLHLKVNKSKDFKLAVGGHFSSRPVNTGYIGFSYYSMGKAAFRVNLESYFGKFYGSVKANIDFHVPSILPVTIQPYFVMNRWDYFRSFATFFEPVKPSFLIQNELYFGSKFSVPLTNTTRTGGDFRLFYLDDSYYQSEDFGLSDTADHTYFDGVSLRWSLEKNTLNRKQFASEGHAFKLLVNYVSGREHSISGSIGNDKYDIVKDHNWINVQAEANYFFLNTKISHTGGHLVGVFNSQSLFKNYTASILSTTAFAPTPDSRTYFLPEYRSPQYIGFGINQVFTFKNRIDLRIDAYGFQPFVEIERNPDGSFGYDRDVGPPRFMGSASIIYFSPLGPIRGTLNYFPYQNKPISFQISFGYLLFNERAIR